MIRPLPILAVAALALAALAAQPREYEIVAVEPGPWSVTARDVETGLELSFRLDPSHLQGLTFFAPLDAASPGQRVSITGVPGVRIDGAEALAPSRGGGPGRPPEPPRRPPARERERSARPPGGSGGQEYLVVSVDPRLRSVTARPVAGGPAVRLAVDPDAFLGYRFEAAVTDLVPGSPLNLVARNERPLADCCTVLGPG
jgi:hypothetical protein